VVDESSRDEERNNRLEFSVFPRLLTGAGGGEAHERMLPEGAQTKSGKKWGT